MLQCLLHRFAFQPSDVDIEAPTSPVFKLPKAPDILVLHVDDIHPITHLQVSRIIHYTEIDIKLFKTFRVYSQDLNL